MRTTNRRAAMAELDDDYERGGDLPSDMEDGPEELEDAEDARAPDEELDGEEGMEVDAE